MKSTPFFITALAAALILSTVSCDKETDPGEPAGTVILNMMSEDNGKTLLGYSDVYIDKAYNFYGPFCGIASLGHTNGLRNTSPVLDGLSSRVAVEPGNAYQIFKNSVIRKFPSGKSAIDIDADYYNVYVVSQIKQNDVVAGASVKFILSDVPGYGLPEYNTNIGTLSWYSQGSSEIIYSLPTSDFEVVPEFASSAYYTLEYEKSGKDLIVRLVNYKQSDVFGFYIRINGSYTYVYGEVK